MDLKSVHLRKCPVSLLIIMERPGIVGWTSGEVLTHFCIIWLEMCYTQSFLIQINQLYMSYDGGYEPQISYCN